jgi:hypothetical protein
MFETDVPTCGASGHHRSSQRHFVCCMLYAARFMLLHVGRMPFVLRSVTGNRSSKGPVRNAHACAHRRRYSHPITLQLKIKSSTFGWQRLQTQIHHNA